MYNVEGVVGEREGGDNDPGFSSAISFSPFFNTLPPLYFSSRSVYGMLEGGVGKGKILRVEFFGKERTNMGDGTLEFSSER